MDLMKAGIIVLFYITLVSISAAQDQQEDFNETDTPEVADVTVPGDTFYGLKKARESISLALARAPIIGSPDKEAEVLSRNADERLREARKLIERNDTERAEQAFSRYADTIGLAKSRAESSSNNRTREEIAEKIRANQEVLQRVSQNVPEQAQSGIQNAIESSRNAQESLTGVPKEGRPQENVSDRISRGPGIPEGSDLTSEQSSDGGGGPAQTDGGSESIGSPGIGP